MPPVHVLHRYVLLLVGTALAISLLFLMHDSPTPLDIVACVFALGLVVGQFWRLEPPR